MSDKDERIIATKKKDGRNNWNEQQTQSDMMMINVICTQMTNNKRKKTWQVLCRLQLKLSWGMWLKHLDDNLMRDKRWHKIPRRMIQHFYRCIMIQEKTAREDSRHEGLSIESRDEVKLVQEQETQTLQTLVKSSSSLFRPLGGKKGSNKSACVFKKQDPWRGCVILFFVEEGTFRVRRTYIASKVGEKEKGPAKQDPFSLTSKYRRSNALMTTAGSSK